jgi:hypothetical protein
MVASTGAGEASNTVVKYVKVLHNTLDVYLLAVLVEFTLLLYATSVWRCKPSGTHSARTEFPARTASNQLSTDSSALQTITHPW